MKDIVIFGLPVSGLNSSSVNLVFCLGPDGVVIDITGWTMSLPKDINGNDVDEGQYIIDIPLAPAGSEFKIEEQANPSNWYIGKFESNITGQDVVIFGIPVLGLDNTTTALSWCIESDMFTPVDTTGWELSLPKDINGNDVDAGQYVINVPLAHYGSIYKIYEIDNPSNWYIGRLTTKSYSPTPNPAPSPAPSPAPAEDVNILETNYLRLITSQYQLSSKFMSQLNNYIQKIEDATVSNTELWEYFDLDFAIGSQLDILGIVLGRSRVLSFQPTDGSSNILDDDTYRILLKAKIAWNQWDGRTQSLYAIWQELFPGGTIIINDSLLMSAVITMYGSFSPIIIDLINNGLIVPRPEGVQYTYDFGSGPYFGFDYDNVYVSGFDTGKFI